MICKTCNARGQTRETATVMEGPKNKPTTKYLGSGCPDCLGLGIKGERRAR